ncbi:MBL fold metallo-hydrolase [Halodesulfurarchaeum sp. HSR-GB]|uniref:ComEC/Rec2 family competence protein n=1 Tax=Halodesulfurarchaeum sp. HSR-GB TaxID=3074077 RepID=UPI002863BABF|nr:MBL fold metallo-hydrolase [Halodesulfurarchaeum sp. HSR-GB]MDR5657707.1 MBL fold metallo-hydrolase [Halodesulfurarchaeum sp. HSR-GB]
MAAVEIYIWDVERGDAIFIKGPERNAIIDLGQHANGFSPSRHIHTQHGVDSVDYLVLTHPDEDHIEDLPEFQSYFSPEVVARRDEADKYIRRRKNDLYPDRSHYQAVTEAYLTLTDTYDQRATFSPSKPSWNGGLTFSHHILSLEEAGTAPIEGLTDNETVNLNNLSILTVLEFGSFKLVTAGDLEKEAIETLLQKSSVQDDLRGTDVLIAPHHGRESSYTPKLFKYTTPDLVAISDAKAGSTNASQKYSAQATGATVFRRSGSTTSRSVVTTRQDGVIDLGIDDDGYRVRID